MVYALLLFALVVWWAGIRYWRWVDSFTDEDITRADVFVYTEPEAVIMPSVSEPPITKSCVLPPVTASLGSAPL